MHAQTVLGPIAADQMGITLPHEHLLIDFDPHVTLAIHLGIGGRLLLDDATRKQPRSLSMEIR